MHDTSIFLQRPTREAKPCAASPATRLDGAGAYEAPRGRDFPPHLHPIWEMVYYRAGCIDCWIGGEKYAVRPGMMLLTPPGVTHSENARTAYANFYCNIEAPPKNLWPRVCYDDGSGTLGNLCAALVREWRGREPERDTMIALLLEQLGVFLRRACQERHVCGEEHIVREVERYFEEHFARALTIEGVAREVGVAPSTLREYFARHRGCAPQAFLHQVRARHAIDLLRGSNLTLETIADLCGYDSASHLSRHLKRTTGQSPGSLRQ